MGTGVGSLLWRVGLRSSRGGGADFRKGVCVGGGGGGDWGVASFQ